MQKFKDHFSGHAADYQKFRPLYPRELFTYLIQTAPANLHAWDCGTGNGQAALELARGFDTVSASDPSADQIKNAPPHEKVNYLVAPAEQVPLEDHSVDLITVAQALHWFDFEKFFTEVKRVGKPGALLAVWCYEMFRIDPAQDQLMDHFYRKVIGSYWPPERIHIENQYNDINFPFELLETPDFNMEASWDLKECLGYLSTWSGVKNCISDTGNNPLEPLGAKMHELWGDENKKQRIIWPLTLKLLRL